MSRNTFRGFTLIEILVSIAIVGVLVSILAVVLREARQAGRGAVSLLNLKQHAIVFTQYTSDWKDSFPLFLSPRQYTSTFKLPHHNVSIDNQPYFEQSTLWHWALADQYYNGQIRHQSFYSPNSGYAGSHVTDYQFACCFLAAPSYWNTQTRQVPFSQWRSTSMHEVRFPSAKVLLAGIGTVQQKYMSQSQPITMGTILKVDVALVDGSARTLSEPFGSGQYPTGDGQHSGTIHHAAWPPFLHTIDGVQGRDMQ